ncbi:MAG: GIY-YIG nuclease family protein [Alphaproteobacteria bacterium]|nr:GIY-YIG nuclease family protein [Alphaproteobacteria bacterium]
MKKILYISALISVLYAQAYDCLASGSARESFNYELKYGRTVVYRGQTNNLRRRESEHLRDGKKFTHMRKIGKAKTNQGAREAEQRFLEAYRKSHNGQNPKYNQTDHG